MNFDLNGARVVITGSGAGIGAAMARRFVKHGARVVVADLDGNAAETVAEQVSGIAVTADAATERGVEQLLTTSLAKLGEIDLFCANAGIAPHGGPDTTEDTWLGAWNVNVMPEPYDWIKQPRAET